MEDSKNLISRQAAIDALDEQIRQCDKALASFDISMKDEYAVKVEKASLCAYRKVLECLPSTQPEQRWIPVTERLPEKPNMYTVTDSKGDVVRFVFNDTESSRKYWLRCAKAWRPLPEPYREGGEADESD